jgi:hypothetical protein
MSPRPGYAPEMEEAVTLTAERAALVPIMDVCLGVWRTESCHFPRAVVSLLGCWGFRCGVRSMSAGVAERLPRLIAVSRKKSRRTALPPLLLLSSLQH